MARYRLPLRWFVGNRLVVVLAAGGLGYGLYLGARVNSWLEPVAGMVAVMGVPLGLLLYLFAKDRDQLARQRYRDRRAARRIARLRNGAAGFSLYLRPFASTGGVRILRRVVRRRNSRYSPTRIGPGVDVTHRQEITWHDLETVLAGLLATSTELVGLGRPGEQLGAARLVSTTEQWQSLVIDLATHARMIFLVPAVNRGTMWEMRLLTRNPRLLAKTVFIVPGTGNPDRHIGTAPGPLKGHRHYSLNPLNSGPMYSMDMRKLRRDLRKILRGL